MSTSDLFVPPSQYPFQGSPRCLHHLCHAGQGQMKRASSSSGLSQSHRCTACHRGPHHLSTACRAHTLGLVAQPSAVPSAAGVPFSKTLHLHNDKISSQLLKHHQDCWSELKVLQGANHVFHLLQSSRTQSAIYLN